MENFHFLDYLCFQYSIMSLRLQMKNISRIEKCSKNAKSDTQLHNHIPINYKAVYEWSVVGPKVSHKNTPINPHARRTSGS